MPVLYKICDDSRYSRLYNDCLDIERGRIRSVAFVKKSFIRRDADGYISNAVETSSWWHEGILRGAIEVVPQTRGTFDGGKSITVPGYGKIESFAARKSFTVEIHDPEHKENWLYYAKLAEKRGQYHLVFMTETQLRISDTPVNIDVGDPVEEDTDSGVLWTCNITWTQDKLTVQSFDARVAKNIFEDIASDSVPEIIGEWSAYVCLFDEPEPEPEPEPMQWTIRQAAQPDMAWRSVCYGEQIFVAVANSGNGGRGMISPNGINWTAGQEPLNLSWQSVCYGRGLFVAVGYNESRIITSLDGINWTERLRLSFGPGWRSICYGNGLFCAVHARGLVYTSPDGINWTERQPAQPDMDWSAICYGNGLFVAVSSAVQDRQVMTSPDGINWTERQTPQTDGYHWYSVCYGNGIFVAVGSNDTSTVMISTDGINWAFIQAPKQIVNAWRSVCYGNGLFCAVANNGINRVMTSPDGINWTVRRSTEADTGMWYSICYGDGMLVAVGNNAVMTSLLWN